MWCLRTQLKIYQVPSDYLIVNYKILFIQQQLFKRAIDMQTQNIHPQLYTLFFLIAPHFFVKKVQKKWHRFKVLEKFQQVKKVSGRCRQKKLKLNQKLEVSQVQRLSSFFPQGHIEYIRGSYSRKYGTLQYSIVKIIIERYIYIKYDLQQIMPDLFVVSQKGGQYLFAGSSVNQIFVVIFVLFGNLFVILQQTINFCACSSEVNLIIILTNVNMSVLNCTSMDRWG
eukprot:TRINITY_DN28206_c1_g1_i3.p1 TRINITY_DN28206_c1_g1~~TRINITY_DN28206_c1_g1_i3.p1  ORF type:complete len:226 (-),score=-6.01 TRINITY_DN28206_c1_g1_i3:148-825(-)